MTEAGGWVTCLVDEWDRLVVRWRDGCVSGVMGSVSGGRCCGAGW